MYVLNARIIKQRMKGMEDNQSKRQAIAQQYNEAFADLPIVTPRVTNGLNNNYHKYVIRFEDKDTRKRVKNALNASIHYETPLSANGMYKNATVRSDVCTASKTAADTVISLPIHAWLTKDEVLSIIDTIRREL